MNKLLPLLLALLLPARALGAASGRAPARVAELAAVLQGVHVSQIPPSLSAFVLKVQALTPAQPALPAEAAAQALPAALVLERVAVELGGLSPEKLQDLAPEELESVAGRALDGAARLKASEPSLPTLSEPRSAGALMKGLVGPRGAEGVKAEAFADEARNAFLADGGDPEALSLSELRRSAESLLAAAAVSWPAQAARLSGRDGAQDVGRAAYAAAQAVAGLPSLAELEKRPSKAAGRDEAALAAVMAFEQALAEAPWASLSKAARRDVSRLRRAAFALRSRLARLLALTELARMRGPGGEDFSIPGDLDQTALMLGHLSLRDRSDLVAKNPALSQILDAMRSGGGLGRQLVVHASLLGTPQVRRSIEWLKPGARAVVLGGGPAAAQAALDALALNPGLKVTLLVEKLEAFPGLARAKAEGRLRVVVLGYKPVFRLRSQPVADASRDVVLRREGAPGYGTAIMDASGHIESFDGPMIVSAGLF